MKNYLLIICFICLSTSALTAQSRSEAYVYAEVPYKFSFLSEKNQFQLNILARVLLQDAGFVVYMDVEDKPLEVLKSPCELLKFELEEIDSFMRKRLQFNLVNCYGQVVYTSDVGESRKKKFKESYAEALKATFLGFSKSEVEYMSGQSELSTTAQQDSNSSLVALDVASKIDYEYMNQTYWLVEDGENYKIITPSDRSIYAQLEKADRGTYIFTTEQLVGAAYFNPKGDLIIEYKDTTSKSESSPKKIEFKKL